MPIDLERVEERCETGERLLLACTYRLLGILEHLALMVDLLFLRIDLLLKPLYELPHLGDLG